MARRAPGSLPAWRWGDGRAHACRQPGGHPVWSCRNLAPEPDWQVEAVADGVPALPRTPPRADEKHIAPSGTILVVDDELMSADYLPDR